MKTLTLLLAALLVMPFAAFAEPATTNCEKDHAPAAVVVPKKKPAKKKEEKKAPPVAFVAPPEKEIVEKEVIKEVPVIVEKQVIVQVPVPVAAPVVEHAAPAPVASQPIVRKRPHHVDNAHPLDTDGLASAPLNPPQQGLNNTLTGVAIGAGLMYGLSR